MIIVSNHLTVADVKKLEDLGHTVIIAEPFQVSVIPDVRTESTLKTDDQK